MTAAKKTSKPQKKTRVRALPTHRSFRLSKKKLSQTEPLPSLLELITGTARIIGANKKLFLGIAFVNLIVTFVFVQGFGSSLNVSEIKLAIEESIGGDEKWLTAISLFGFLVGAGGGTSSADSAVYQMFLVLITSLAVIWATRQVLAGEKPIIRDAFYKGMYPLIPFLLLLFVIALQLIPFLVGNLIFNTVLQNALAITALEKILWFLLFLVLALLSGYMIISSAFALYIATLPDMQPLKALRSARELVLHRRLSVALRLIALPILLFSLLALIIVPLLIIAAPVAQITFLFGYSIAIVIWHVYMYLLYRSLL